ESAITPLMGEAEGVASKVAVKVPFCVRNAVFCHALPAVTHPVVITKVTVVLWLRLPLAPMTVNRYVPGRVTAEVDTASVEDPDPPTEAGLKLAVAPGGSPLTLKLTAPANPFDAVTLTV